MVSIVFIFLYNTVNLLFPKSNTIYPYISLGERQKNKAFTTSFQKCKHTIFQNTSPQCISALLILLTSCFFYK